MKQFCFLFVEVLFVNMLMAQSEKVCLPCLSEGIKFSSQAQINNFQTDYPNCTEILGDVTIEGSSWYEIEYLNGLSVLTSIGGYLVINENHALNYLEGLDSLTSIGGNLIITNDLNLRSLNALKKLISIQGILKITDNVLTNLEGLNNVTSVSGDLILEDNIALTSLTGLDNLKSIGGGIYIGWNYELGNLTGLDSLSTIGSYLIIEGNPNLTSLTGLDNLISIGDSTVIHRNDGLATLTGLGKLTSIGGGLRIDSNYDLDSITGPANLTFVGGDLVIQDNQVLSGLNGFDHLASIGGDLNINYNSDLPVIAGFDHVTSIGGDLIIYHDDALNDVTGLNKLTSIGGDLFIKSNYYLSGLSGLDSITSIGGLYIDSNHDLPDLTGLKNLTSLGNSVYLYWNSKLTNLTGLEKLDSIQGAIIVLGNDALADFTGLENLVSIGGDFLISYNTALTSLKGLGKVTSIGSKLDINHNSVLATLTGPDTLLSIGGDFLVENNGALASLLGLDHLTSIGGDFIVKENGALTGFSGLLNLTSIGGDLSIDNNMSLTSLAGLDSINEGSISNLSISNNYLLSACSVKSICDYLENPNGTSEIKYNAMGCNNCQEVKNICAGMEFFDFIFSAIDSLAYIKLDSIRVMNRSQSGDTVIYWPQTRLTLFLFPGDTLLYIGYSKRYPYGIRDLDSYMDNFTLFQNYPNPVTDQSRVSLYIPEQGTVTLMVTDLLGRVVISTDRQLEKGNHSFSFRTGGDNFYLLTARWKWINRSIKILSTGSNSGERCSLDYLGTDAGESRWKSSSQKAGLIMQESGILDAPDTNKTYTFQFATNIPCLGTTTVTYEGQVYNTIQIFSQCWLKENLNIGTMIKGDQDQTNNDIIEKYCYNNSPDSCTKYGGLYQWDEMMQYTNVQGVKGICPPGWHIPADEEWKVLEGAVDSHFGIGDKIWDYNIMNRGYDAGSNLKASTGWKYEGNGTDLFGFSGLPGGIRFDGGIFNTAGECGGWWTSSEEYNGSLPWYRSFNSGYNYPARGSDSNKSRGYSIRCIMDE